MPLVAPEREAAAEPATAVVDGTSGGATAAEGQAAAGDARTESSVSPAGRLIPPRKRATADEIEPNDGYDTANQITVGGSIRGTAAENSGDWFVMPIEPTLPSVHVKVGAGEHNVCIIHFHSAEETAIDDHPLIPEENTVASRKLPLDGTAAVFLRVENPSYFPCAYELFTGREPL